MKTIQPAILLYALLGAILTIPYVIWRQRSHYSPVGKIGDIGDPEVKSSHA